MACTNTEISCRYIFSIFEDNQSCINLTSRFEYKRLKYVDVKFNFVGKTFISLCTGGFPGIQARSGSLVLKRTGFLI